MRVGMVLEGGAMRGMYTAGVLDVMMQAGIKVDGIVAVSAGALFGVNYPSQQIGRTIRYNLKYLHDKRYMGWRSLLTSGNIVNKNFAYYQVPFELDKFDQAAFKQSGVAFYVVVTNLMSGQAEYIQITDVFEQMEVLRASSAMPLVSQKVDLNGTPYLDGGIADSIPIEFAQSLGFDKLIVILTRPLTYRKKSHSTQLYEWAYRHYPNFVSTWKQRPQRYNQQVEQIIRLAEAGEIFVIRPSQTIALSRLEKNPIKIQAMYDLGASDGKLQLKDLQNYLDI